MGKNDYAWFNERVLKIKKALSQAKTRRVKETAFEYKPFSVKQKKILTWWVENSPVKDMDGIIADGAIRSGKTMSMSLSFGLWAMHCFDKQNFLICGKTIGSLRRNVIFDWKRQMKSHGFSIKEQRTDNLLIVTKGQKINYFYLFGGKDESSQDLVQGITAAGVFFDEVALQPESFVNQATGRCSVSGSKFWFNCNPEGPFHWFKVNWINRISGMDPDAVFDEENPPKKLVYLHFTMDDNLSLSDEIKLRYRSMYRGVFYQRFISGLWYVASGLIYDMFDKDIHTKGTAPEACRRYVAVDYGTTNPTVFLAIADDGKRVWVEKEYYYDSIKEGKQKSDTDYADDFDKFIEEWGHRPLKVVIDPSAANFRLVLRRRHYRVTEADNDVLDGIRKVSSMLALDNLYVNESCTNTIKEFYSYTWDTKAAESGVEKPVKQQDHAMDALRYFINTVLKDRRFTVK